MPPMPIEDIPKEDKPKPKLNSNSFKFQGSIFHLLPLEKEDIENLNKRTDDLVSITTAKVVDDSGKIIGYAQSVAANLPPLWVSSILGTYLRIFSFPNLRNPASGLQVSEITRTGFTKELEYIRKYNKERPLDDAEMVQEVVESKTTSFSKYLREAKYGSKNFKYYFEELKKL